MAVNTAHVATPPEDVWAVLADGWRYGNWVVGTSHVRAVEAAWPALGSRLFHASGVWPVVTRDETVVTACTDGRRLELLARGRPMGEARVELELEPADDGCRVTMTEVPVSGPGRWLHTPVSEAMLVRRNDESLARLAATAERRTSPDLEKA